MKRLALFISVFGVGLLVLVLTLGPDRLWRRTKTKSIRPEDLPPSPAALAIGEQGRKVGLRMSGSFTIPRWKQVPQPDGSVLQIKSAQLKGLDSEPFAGGLHLVQPQIEIFPGKGQKEQVQQRVTAAAGDLETTRDLRSFADSRPQKGDIGRLVLGPDVKLEMLDPQGEPTVTITTSQIEVPKPPPGRDDEEASFARLVGDKPVRILMHGSGPDPSDAVLTAAGFELDRLAGHLELTGPITLASNGMNVTCDGNVTFDPRDGPPAGASRDRRSGVEDPTQALGPGTLVFRRNVHVRQIDPVTGDERWLRTDFVSLDVERGDPKADPKGAAAPAAGALPNFKITRIDAGSPDSDVAFRLLGGEGVARHLRRGADDAITLDGPLHVDGLQVGDESAAARSTISLESNERLLLEPVAVAVGAPERWRARLAGAAHATSTRAEGTLEADADTLTAELVERAAPAAKGAASVKDGATGGRFDLGALELVGHARLDLHEQGNANAHRIEVRDGGRTAHLDGDAVVKTPQGTLRGPTIDLELPGAPTGPATAPARPGTAAAKGAARPKVNVTVPRLTGGEIELPAGTALFGATPSTRDAPRRLRLEPFDAEKPPRLEIRGDELHLLGRTIVHVFEAPTPERDVLRIAADALDLRPQPDGTRQFVAGGNVDATDFEHDPDPDGPGPHRRLLAAHARTEPGADGHMHLLLDGTPDLPARGTIPVVPAAGADAKTRPSELTLAALHLDFDLETKRIVADDPVRRVTAWIPEVLVAPALPPGFGALGSAHGGAPKVDPDAPPEPLQFQAEHVEIIPQRDRAQAPAAAALLKSAADEDFARARVIARGRVHAERPSDRTSFDALTMDLNLASAEARIAGTAAEPVHLRRTPLVAAGADAATVAAAAERADEIVTEWIAVTQARDGKPRVQLAARKDGPIIVVHPERAPTNGKPPRPLRVALTCPDPLELQDRRLLLTGGVDTWLFDGDPNARDYAQAHIRSERVELTLNQPISERTAGGLALERLSAQGRVHVDYIAGLANSIEEHVDFREYHAEGNLLTYDFATTELVLKQGAERCRLLAADPTQQWRTVADFEQMTIGPLEVIVSANHRNTNPPDPAVNPKSSGTEKVRLHFVDFHLVAEGVRGR